MSFQCREVYFTQDPKLGILNLLYLWAMFSKCQETSGQSINKQQHLLIPQIKCLFSTFKCLLSSFIVAKRQIQLQQPCTGQVYAGVFLVFDDLCKESCDPRGHCFWLTNSLLMLFTHSAPCLHPKNPGVVPVQDVPIFRGPPKREFLCSKLQLAVQCIH